jgi:hypothetical protein
MKLNCSLSKIVGMMCALEVVLQLLHRRSAVTAGKLCDLLAQENKKGTTESNQEDNKGASQVLEGQR